MRYVEVLIKTCNEVDRAFYDAINIAGAVVQLVRMPACHAGGRGFESRPLRQQLKVEPVRAASSVGRASALQAEGHKFKPCAAHHNYIALINL